MQDLNFNIYNVVILAGMIQGVIFSFVVLLHPKYKSKTNNFIVFTVLALSFSNFQYWTDDVNLNGLLQVFTGLRIPCDMLIVPFFYLFVANYLNESIKLRLLLFLYSPFITTLILNVILYKKIFLNTPFYRSVNVTLEAFSLILSLFLIYLIHLKIKKYEVNTIPYKELEVRTEIKWIRQILIIGTIMCVFWLITIIIMQTTLNTGLRIYYPLWLSISTLVYWISYVGLINSKINTDRITIRSLKRKRNQTQITLNNTLNKKSSSILFEGIVDYIKVNEVYLNPDLNLGTIANTFEISKGYLSQIFNTNNDTNFNDFINELRIEEVKRMLNDKEYDAYTIVAIGLEAGFNSKSSFYSAFKKFTNKTPNNYKKCPK